MGNTMVWKRLGGCLDVCWLGPLGLAGAMALAAPAQAQVQAVSQAPIGSVPYGVYAEAGRTMGSSRADAVALGWVWRFGQEYALWGGSLSGYGDAFVSDWRARRMRNGNYVNYTQLGLMAAARYRFDQGRSPWFFDAVMGVSTMNQRYQTPELGFSTRFQFTPALSMGRNFGPDGVHEVALRVAHYSNGGLRSPNPSENFLRVRYVYRF